MRIGIHLAKGSFSDQWISYCEANGIGYKLVNCFRSDIIEQLHDCDALMWHFHHAGAKETMFAKQLLYSVQLTKRSVFPNFNTMWHFDDKVGQKYLLESIAAPLVTTWVFYSKQDAIFWAKKTTYPKVFKLRRGAASANVRLVTTPKEAARLIKKAFGRGFSQNNAMAGLKERWRKFRLGKTDLFDVIKGLVRFVYSTEFARVVGRERGYAYFQEYISGNDSDIRVVVIDQKAFAIKRIVRHRDFRASGSGTNLYEKNLFDEETIRLSFELAGKLNVQSIAFDYVYKNKQPLLVEISYGILQSGYEKCPGYWDHEMIWHEGKFNPYVWMVEELIRSAESAPR